MAIRNIELQTATKFATLDAASLNIGGQVPSGMTRWVTFIQVDTNTRVIASDMVVHFASVSISNPSEASSVLLTNRKLKLSWKASNVSICNCGGLPYMLPDGGPDPDNPLFSIAGGNWCGVYASLGATANVFMQYFDE